MSRLVVLIFAVLTGCRPPAPAVSTAAAPPPSIPKTMGPATMGSVTKLQRIDTPETRAAEALRERRSLAVQQPIRRAEEALERDDLDAAERALAEFDPDAPEAYSFRNSARKLAGDIALLRRDYARAAELYVGPKGNPIFGEGGEGGIGLALAELRLGRPERARRLVGQDGPDHELAAELHRRRANFFALTGRSGQAARERRLAENP